MSKFDLSMFAYVPHLLIIEPAGFTPWGRERWRYSLISGDQEIFSEREMEGPTGVTEDKIAAHALGWLTLRPGDTDGEFFSDYTPRQLEWCSEYAEYLSLALCDENGDEVTELSAYRADP